MNITEVKIKIVENNDKLKGFCSIIFENCFVIRDMKLIDGDNGLFIAMPSRRIMEKCVSCSAKNHTRAKYCNECGVTLPEIDLPQTSDGRYKLFADIAHPINSSFRSKIEKAILAEYKIELDKSKQPDYKSKYNDLDN
jgi:stage V sporulation protein G